VAELAAMTWEEVRDLDRSRSIAILPVGAVEAHGPHLPLNTDVVIARAMAAACARRLMARGNLPVVLPAISYTAAGYAAGFEGTVSVTPEIVTRLIVDIARSLGRQGFPVLAVANAHLDPAHLAALERAGAEIGRESLLGFAFPNIALKPWAPRLTEEFRSGACHAGRFETSIVLAAEPSLVRGQVSGELVANPVSLSRAIRDGKGTFEEAGGPRAYFGDPARASREEGLETIETLGAILEEAVLAARGSR
jgi:creatinine amidohydrolase